MTRDIMIGLHGENQPSWAVGQHANNVWYFENDLGEQWVAKRDGDILRITGLDIDWEEITLTVEQAIPELNRLKEYLCIKTLVRMPHLQSAAEQIIQSYKMSAATSDQNIKTPLTEWIFNDTEAYWLVSVLEAAVPKMKWERENNN